MKTSTYLLLPLLLAALAAVASHGRWLATLDQLVFDHAHQLRAAPAAGNTVLVAIDEQSIATLGRWPWPRAVHARLLERLQQARSGPVVLDILFADPQPAQDALLATAIADHGQVVLPMYIEALTDRGQLVEVTPTPQIYRSAASIGHAHIACDDDGICRSVFLYEGLGRPGWPHIALAALQLQQPDWPVSGSRPAQPPANSPMLIARDYQNFIPFASGSQLTTVSYIDVLEQRIPLSVFAGKTVFVGITTTGVHDVLATPVGQMAGVKITAAVYQALRHKQMIQAVARTPGSALIGLVVFILLMSLSLLTPLKFLLSTLVASLALTLLSVGLLLYANVWLPTGAATAACLAFYPLYSWLRLELAMRYLQRTLTVFDQQTPAPVPAITLPVSQPAKAPWRRILSPTDTVRVTINRLHIAHQAFLTSNQLFTETVANLQEGCIVFTANGDCLIANPRARLFLPAWDGANVFTVGDLLPTAIASQWQNQLHTLLNQGQPFQVETAVNDQNNADDGQRFLLQGGAAHLAHQREGDNTGSDPVQLGILTITDITTVKRMEKAQRETLHFVSHDLRSPLISILSLLEQNALSRSPAVTADILQKIRFYAERNLAYTETLLQLYRAEHVQTEKFVLCDLHAVCDDAYSQILAEAEAAACPVTMTHCDEDCWVNGDFELLQRAVVNLLTNAIKYGRSARGIALTLSAPANNDPMLADIRVTDWGPGLTEHEAATAFNKFYRTGTARQSGAGLGLYFVKTVVEQHSGTLTLETNHRAGCQMCIRLTLQDVSADLD